MATAIEYHPPPTEPYPHIHTTLPPAYAPPPVYTLDPYPRTVRPQRTRVRRSSASSSSSLSSDADDSHDHEHNHSQDPATTPAGAPGSPSITPYTHPSRALKTAFLRSVMTLIPTHPNPRTYKKSMTPLHWAVFTGDLPAVHALLLRPVSNPGPGQSLAPASVDTSLSKRTAFRALHVAALFDRTSIARLLIRFRAAVSTGDASGWTPLHYAAQAGSLATAQLLLDAGAAISAASHGMHSTPLHCAADAGRVELVRLLVSAGAHVDAENAWRWTPLHCAAQKGHVEVVRCLVGCGAGLERLTKTKSTPAEVAGKFGQRGVVEVLVGEAARRAGARTAVG